MYKKTVLTVAVHLEPLNPVFGEGVTHVSVEDEGGGVFVTLSQADEGQVVRLDKDELKLVFEVAQELLAQFPEEDQ